MPRSPLREVDTLPVRGVIASLPCAVSVNTSARRRKGRLHDLCANRDLEPHLYRSTFVEMLEYAESPDCIHHRWREDEGENLSVLELQRTTMSCICRLGISGRQRAGLAFAVRLYDQRLIQVGLSRLGPPYSPYAARASPWFGLEVKRPSARTSPPFIRFGAYALRIYFGEDYGLQLPALGYDFDDLEPTIDARTMEIHHGKHHAGYVAKLNAALEGHDDLAAHSVADLCRNLDTLRNPSGSRANNGGGHFNHTLFWSVMSPNGGGTPSGALAEAIDKAFGSFDAFKTEFQNAGASRFGSGWARLCTGRRSLCLLDRQSRQPPDARSELRQNPNFGLRCLGACLLPQIPKSPSRLPHGVVGSGGLEQGLRSLQQG